jgi:hypothetical protein
VKRPPYARWELAPAKSSPGARARTAPGRARPLPERARALCDLPVSKAHRAPSAFGGALALSGGTRAHSLRGETRSSPEHERARAEPQLLSMPIEQVAEFDSRPWDEVETRV